MEVAEQGEGAVPKSSMLKRTPSFLSLVKRVAAGTARERELQSAIKEQRSRWSRDRQQLAADKDPLAKIDDLRLHSLICPLLSNAEIVLAGS
jgi:hypothetical protein